MSKKFIANLTRSIYLICCFFLLTSSFTSNIYAASSFTDETSTYGIGSVADNNWHLISSWIDIDNDGDFDLYNINYGPDNTLYLNNGSGQLFTEATSTYDLGDSSGSKIHWGGAWIDVDNDNDFDFYSVKEWGDENKLFVNNGVGQVFTDATDTYGIGDGTGGHHNSAAWADIDNDGDLDLYSIDRDIENSLFINNGPNQTMTDATDTYGVGDGTSNNHKQGSWIDVDNDGDLDLYTVNIYRNNKLYINNGPNQTMTDATDTYGVGDGTTYHLAAAWVDIDNDGDLDLYSVNYLSDNKLFINNGSGQTMTDATSTYGLGGGSVRHLNSTWIDIDNDGDLDLYLIKSNGVNNALYLNNGSGQAFTDATSTYGLGDGTPTHRRSASWIDIDNDGDLDIYTIINSASNHLYINPGQGNNYLKVAVNDSNGRYQYHTRVEVDLDGNNDFSTSGDYLMQYQESSAHAGCVQHYHSQDPVGLFFGLGSDSSCKYDVRVFLPGTSPSSTPDYSIENVCPNQSIVIPGPSVTVADTTYTNDNTPTTTGSATNAHPYTLSNVQYQIDSTTGSWSDCSASDGSFNSTSENFSCTPTSALTEGGHTVYIRSTDVSGAVNAGGSLLGSDSFTVDTTAPASFSLNSPSGYCSGCQKPTLVFKKATDATAGMSSYSVALDESSNRNFSTSGIPTSGNGSSSYVWKDDNDVKIAFANEDDSDSTNDEIHVYFKNLDSGELTEGKHSWRVSANDSAGNSRTETKDFYLDKTSPTISDLAIADVAIVSSKGEYQLARTNRMPAFSGKAIDPYSGSTRTNDNGTSDTFDKVCSGPDKITLEIKKLDQNKSPKKDENYIDHLNQEYTLTDIQDDSGNEKTTSFFLNDFPYPLEDGHYQVNLSLKDQAGNTHSYPSFYLSLNYHRADPSFSKPGQLRTQIIEQETIPTETEEEKEKVKKEGYTVQVKVVDEKNKPVEGVRVELHSEPQTAYTNQEGIVIFEKIKPGRHTIKIAYEGYQGEQIVDLQGDAIKQFNFTIIMEKKNVFLHPVVLTIMGVSVLIISFLTILVFKKKNPIEKT